MDRIQNMKKTLGERIREQRILKQMTQEELAEELCVKKSTFSMYENDKVDIKGSILIELSRVLHTSPNYLLGMEDYDEDLEEMISLFRSIKNAEIRQAMLTSVRAFSSII
ncbi:MAG: helix-turn-helix transcriptional regulator [Eubacterium sp.]|nr:helix-turn-helix transcriptional regulator [Eubacterium sp.]